MNENIKREDKMPTPTNITIKRAFLKWDMSPTGKYGLYLFIIIEYEAGNQKTLRQSIFNEFYNPSEISDLVAGLIEQQFTKMLEIPVPPGLSAQIPKFSDEELSAKTKDEELPARQFKVADLGIDLNEE